MDGQETATGQAAHLRRFASCAARSAASSFLMSSGVSFGRSRAMVRLSIAGELEGTATVVVVHRCRAADADEEPLVNSDRGTLRSSFSVERTLPSTLSLPVPPRPYCSARGSGLRDSALLPAEFNSRSPPWAWGRAAATLLHE
jgi:hypothetical protein